MGYTTDFWGAVKIKPPLSNDEINFLQKFSETRRMHRKKGPFYVNGMGMMGQDHEDDVINYNQPPPGQPSLWCQWQPAGGGTLLVWDGSEKFYEAEHWMKYIMEHFMAPSAEAKNALPFLQPHTCNGEIYAQGEDRDDAWMIEVEDNVVKVSRGHVEYSTPVEI
jgi:hypothetical protein